MARGEISLGIYLASKETLAADISRSDAAVQKIGKSAASSAKEATAAIGSIRGVVEQVEAAWHEWTTGINQGLELLNKAQRAVGWVGDQVRAGEEAANVGTIFAAQFADATKALGEFRAATDGTIDDTTLQRIATSMGLVGLSVQETAQIMRGSFALSAASGKDLQEVVSSVLGAIRGEMDSLQEKGVAVDLEAVYDRAATAAGKLAKELTETEKAAARQQAVLAALSQTADKVPVEKLDNGFAKLEATWNNVVSSVQVGLADAIDPLADSLLRVVSVTNEAVGNLETVARGAVDPMVLIGETIQKMRLEGVGDLQIQGAIWRLGNSAMLTTEQIVQLQMGLKRADEVGAAFAGTMERIGERSLASARREFDATTASIGDFLERQGAMLASLGAKVAGSVVAAYKPPKRGAAKDRIDIDLLLADTMFGTVEDNLRAFRENADALLAANDEAFTTAQAETERQRGLFRLRADIEKADRLAQLDERDRLGRLEVEHEFALRSIRRELADADEQQLATELENLRYSIDRRQELRDQELQALREHQAAVEASWSSLADAGSFLGGLAEDGTTQGVAALAAMTGQLGQTFGDVAKGSAGAIVAIGRVGAAVIQDRRAQAAIMSVTETAAGFATLFLNPAESVAHFVAAGLYASVAAGAFGGASKSAGGSAGAAGARASVSPGAASNAERGGGATVYNINGPIVGTSWEAARSLDKTTKQLQGSGHESTAVGF